METNLSRYKKWLIEHEVFIRELIQKNESNPSSRMESPFLTQIVTDPAFYYNYVIDHDFSILGSQGLGAALDICFDNFRITNLEKGESLRGKFPEYMNRWNELADFLAIIPGSN